MYLRLSVLLTWIRYRHNCSKVGKGSLDLAKLDENLAGDMAQNQIDLGRPALLVARELVAVELEHDAERGPLLWHVDLDCDPECAGREERGGGWEPVVRDGDLASEAAGAGPQGGDARDERLCRINCQREVERGKRNERRTLAERLWDAVDGSSTH